MEQHAHYRDATAYLQKLRALQRRALVMVKAHLVHVLVSATDGTMTQIQAEKGNLLLPNTASTEVSIFYIKFRSLAPRIKPLTAELERRANRLDYAALLAECQECYVTQRLRLLQEVVESCISDMYDSNCFFFSSFLFQSRFIRLFYFSLWLKLSIIEYA